MKIRTLTLLIMLLAGASFSYADIVGNTLADDGDGVIVCSTYGFEKTGPIDFQLSIDGIHDIWDTGHILGDIITDTELDPRLTLLHEIDNDTDGEWTDYHAEIKMNKSFTLDNVTVGNTDWTYVITQPTPVGSDWIGTVDYYAGVPVAPGGTLDFGYRMTFVGTVAFCESLTPTPEPGTLVLLACGVVGLFVARRRFAR
jgi:hypothetical protein